MTTRHNLLLLASVLVFSSAATVHADIIPPAEQACTGETVGSACTDPEGMGVCQMAVCHRFDYAHWDRDASPNSPPSMAYDCSVCVVAGHDGGPEIVDGGHTDMSAPPASSHCAVSGPGAGAAGLAPLMMAGLGLLFVRRRSDRRS